MQQLSELFDTNKMLKAMGEVVTDPYMGFASKIQRLLGQITLIDADGELQPCLIWLVMNAVKGKEMDSSKYIAPCVPSIQLIDKCISELTDAVLSGKMTPLTVEVQGYCYRTSEAVRLYDMQVMLCKGEVSLGRNSGV